jgi:hypothetical protein
MKNMTVKLLIFLFFFIFGSTLIGVFANGLYLFLTHSKLPWVIPVIGLFALAPLVAVSFYQRFILRRSLGPEEIILGGVFSILLLTFGLILTFDLRQRIEQRPAKSKAAARFPIGVR